MYEIIRINDLDNAKELLLKHNREIGRNSLTDEELNAGIKKFIDYGDVLAVLDGNHIIAMLNLYCNNYDTLEAYVCNVYVLEKYRGKGYGNALMKKAIDICNERKFKSIHLHVDKKNTPAIKIYKRLGFEFADGKRGEDVEMKLEL